MKLNSNRKTVAKIVAAASSSVAFSWSPACQLNGVENDCLAVQNLRDGLKSNVFGLTLNDIVEPFKTRLVTPVMRRCIKPVVRTFMKPFMAVADSSPVRCLRRRLCNPLLPIVNKHETQHKIKCDINDPADIDTHMHSILKHENRVSAYKDLTDEQREDYLQEFVSRPELFDKLDDRQKYLLMWDSLGGKGTADVTTLLKAVHSKFEFPYRVPEELRKYFPKNTEEVDSVFLEALGAIQGRNLMYKEVAGWMFNFLEEAVKRMPPAQLEMERKMVLETGHYFKGLTRSQRFWILKAIFPLKFWRWF